MFSPVQSRTVDQVELKHSKISDQVAYEAEKETGLTLELSSTTLPASFVTRRSGSLCETMVMPPWIPSCVLSRTNDGR